MRRPEIEQHQVDNTQELLKKLTFKLHTELLSKKLIEKGIDPEISQNYEPSKMSDGEYLFLLKKVDADREFKTRTFNVIDEFCREGENIEHVFEATHLNNAKEISSKIRFREIKDFFKKELERLEKSVRHEDIKPPIIAKEENNEKKNVDLLISIHESKRPIDLKPDRFSMLIRDYVHDANLLMGGSLSEIEKASTIKRLNKISRLIHENKRSLRYLQDKDITSDEGLNSDLIRYVYSMCYCGDNKNLKNLIENLGDRNLAPFFGSIKLEKVIKNEISLEGMLSIINKRAEPKEIRGRDEDEWKEIKAIFDDVITFRLSQDKASLSPQSIVGKALLSSLHGPAAKGSRGV